MNPLDDQFQKLLIDYLYDGVYFVDAQRRILFWNKGAERITGYPSEKVVGTFCNMNLLNHVTDDGVSLCETGCPLLATIRDGQAREAEVHLRHAEGYRVPVQVRTVAVRSENQEILGAVEVFSSNLTNLKMRRRVDELEKQILMDPLLGVGNRMYIEMRVNSAIAEYGQHKIPFGLLLLDVDHFKSVNDQFGHNAGDRVLQNISRTLSHELRASDACGRWGGEEFVVLLMNIDLQGLFGAADKLRAMIASSKVNLDDRDLQVTVSVGGTVARPNDKIADLVERADAFMYQCKSNGRNRVAVG